LCVAGGVGVYLQKDLLLTVGAPYCKYCDWMKPAWDQLALGLQHDRSVVVAHMNGALDRDFAAALGVRTFPTILAFPKTGGAPFVYGSQVCVERERERERREREPGAGGSPSPRRAARPSCTASFHSPSLPCSD
jgi:thiol-disulfide isomerase/thioredoxin